MCFLYDFFLSYGFCNQLFFLGYKCYKNCFLIVKCSSLRFVCIQNFIEIRNMPQKYTRGAELRTLRLKSKLRLKSEILLKYHIATCNLIGWKTKTQLRFFREIQVRPGKYFEYNRLTKMIVCKCIKGAAFHNSVIHSNVR